jgi:hypothetical protein
MGNIPAFGGLNFEAKVITFLHKVFDNDYDKPSIDNWAEAFIF